MNDDERKESDWIAVAMILAGLLLWAAVAGVAAM